MKYVCHYSVINTLYLLQKIVYAFVDLTVGQCSLCLTERRDDGPASHRSKPAPRGATGEVCQTDNLLN